MPYKIVSINWNPFIRHLADGPYVEDIQGRYQFIASLRQPVFHLGGYDIIGSPSNQAIIYQLLQLLGQNLF